MPVREIKTTLSLGGERQYRAALASAKKELQTMRAELKAQTAEFKANGKEQDAAKAQAEGLLEQQKQQEEIVKSLTKALEEAEDKYKDSPDKIANYRKELANARTYLAQLTDQQKAAAATVDEFADAMVGGGEEAEKALAGTEDELADMKDMLQQIADNTSFSALCDGLELVGSAAVAVFNQVKQLYDFVGEMSNWADDLATQSTVTGIDMQTLQGWKYASNFVDTEVDSITGSIKKLKSTMSNADTMEDVWAMFNVSAYDGNGQMRNATDMFWEIIDAANKMKGTLNETEMDQVLQAAFGKGYDELKPLIEGLDDFNARVDEANAEGVVLNDEEVGNLAAYNDSMQQLTANMETLERVWASTLAPVFEAFNDGLTDVIQDVTAWLRDSEVAATLQGLADTVGSVLGMVNSLISGDASFQDVLDTVDQWLTGDTGEAQSLEGFVAGAVQGLVNTLFEGIKGLMKFGSGEDGGGLQAVADAALSGAAQVFFGVLEGLAAGIDDQGGIGQIVSGGLEAVARNVLHGLSQLMKFDGGEGEGGLKEKLQTVVVATMNGIFDGLKALFDFANSPDAAELLSGISQFVCDLFDALIDGILEFIDGKLGTDFSGHSSSANDPGSKYITTPTEVAVDAAGTPAVVRQNAQWVAMNNALNLGGSFARMGDYEAAMVPLKDYAKDHGIDVAVDELDYATAYDTLKAAILEEEPAQMVVEVADASETNLPIEVQNALNGKTYTVVVNAELGGADGVVSVDGSHAGGLDYVPFDNYVARLHRGEMVLTANQAASYRGGGMDGAALDALAAKIVAGMGGIRFELDGRAVGQSVAPVVNEVLARAVG